MLHHHFSVASKPSRAVVLGARGFIASRLIQALRDADIPCRPVGAVEVDLTEFSAPEKLGAILRMEDSVIMCSALTPEKGRDRPTFMKNVRMVENLCAVLEGVRCAHVIYISSDSVYDRRLELVDEQSSCESDDLYALSHIVREKLLRDVCQKSAGPRLAILRPSAVYGPGDTHNSYGPNRFIRSALQTGKIVLFGKGEEIRDHLYIGDLVHLVKLSLLHRSAGVLNAVTGQAVSFYDMAEMIVNAIGTNIVIETESRRVPITHRRFEITALRQAFPEFRPKRLESGIRVMIGEFRELGGKTQDGRPST
jgi:UDP-glucose 4-epimerase